MKTRCRLIALSSITFCMPLLAEIHIEPDPERPGGYIVSEADLEAREAELTSNPMYAVWAKALLTSANSVVEAIEPGKETNPDNVKRAESVFSEGEWNFLTHMAAPEYTYTRFLRAIGKFPAFCAYYSDGRDSDAICKRSIVTAFAHFAQETGGHIAKDNTSDNPLGLEEWQQALVHVREMGWSEGEVGIPQVVVRMTGKTRSGLAVLDKATLVEERNSFPIILITARSLRRCLKETQRYY